MRQIEKVVTIRKIGDQEPLSVSITGQEAIILVEELRRTMISVTGDPDIPIEKAVKKTRFHYGRA